MPRVEELDVAALFAALDERRRARGLSWRGVADEIWAQSATLNERRHDHPISPATLSGIAQRRDTSCQHALFVLRWLGRAPESFLPGFEGDVAAVALPVAGDDRRLRWNLRRLYEALDATRRARGVTWREAAVELRCTPSQLTGLRTARFATGLRLAMRIAQWVGEPARAFVDVASW